MPTEWGDFDVAVLGGGLPAEAESLIAQAGLVRAQTDKAQALLEAARALAPTHPAALIALYRFHFYGNRLADARAVAVDALRIAATALCLPPCWQDVAPQAFAGELSPLPRFYLFSLKGYAYLSLRLGDLETGRGALEKLTALDPRNQTGHAVLSEVLARMGREDWEYEEEDKVFAEELPS